MAKCHFAAAYTAKNRLRQPSLPLFRGQYMSLFSDMHYVTFQQQVQKDVPKQSSFTSFQKLAICAAYNSCICTAPPIGGQL